MLGVTPKTAGEDMNTVIGKDTTFTGTIDVKGGLRVDGVVKGKIVSSDDVQIGPTGFVEAQIESKATIVAGRLVGNIISSERIELQAKSDVEGDLRTKSLIIEQGAIFCGGCHMKDGKSSLNFVPPPAPEEKKDREPHPQTATAGASFGFALKPEPVKEKART